MLGKIIMRHHFFYKHILLVTLISLVSGSVAQAQFLRMSKFKYLSPLQSIPVLVTLIPKVPVTEMTLKTEAKMPPPQLISIPILKPRAKPPAPISYKALKALQPTLNHKISDIDSATIKAIVNAIANKQYDKARSLRDILTDTNALSLVDWLYFRKSGRHYSPDQAQNFVSRHKRWPNIGAIKRKIEIARLGDNQTALEIMAHFKKRAPITKQGKIRLAIALQEHDKTRRALKYIHPLWHHTTLSLKQEQKILASFKDHLSAKDHNKRIDYLLYQHRKKYVSAAKRLFKFIDKDAKQIHTLRTQYITSRRVSEKRFIRLSDTQKMHSGLLFNRAVWLRKRKRLTESWAILMYPNTLKQSASALSKLDWKERRRQIRTALNKGHAPIAYAMAKQHGKLSASNASEATFLAGWLALRFMNQPKEALQHFNRMKKTSMNKHAKAKLHYWLGRTYGALSKPIQAQNHWRTSAHFPHSYYGQLSSYYMPSSQSTGLRALPVINARDARIFNNMKIVKSIIIAHKTGMHSMKGRLIRHLSWSLKSPTHMALLAELTHQIGKKRDIIKLAKVGLYRKFPLDLYAYPANAVPKDYQRLNTPVEKDLISALIRQESEFNRHARSHVGARGLMQLMPGTARAVARQYRVRYDTAMLTVSPSYNVMLGSALLSDLLEKYNGSYILTLIAYNAGPGRSNRWSAAFGNPGDKHIDTIDWVERIPFKETRHYVKKIMSSLQFFRHKSGAKRPMRLMSDLKRGGTRITLAQQPVQ